MEGADLQTAQMLAQQCLDAAAHFAGRFIGEGDRHDAVMRHAMLADQPSDAPRQHRCFAAAGSSQHQYGTIAGADRPLLLLVHAFGEWVARSCIPSTRGIRRMRGLGTSSKCGQETLKTRFLAFQPSLIRIARYSLLSYTNIELRRSSSIPTLEFHTMQCGKRSCANDEYYRHSDSSTLLNPSETVIAHRKAPSKPIRSRSRPRSVA